MEKIDWVKHWNTKITELDSNNFWIPQMQNEDYKLGYDAGYNDGYDSGVRKSESDWNNGIDSIISDLEDLKV